MKIVVIGTRGIPNILGGVETHCEELFPRIAALGNDVTVIRRKPYVAPDNRISDYRGVHLIDLYAPHIKSLEAIVHTTLAVFKARRLHPDILHIHAIGPSLCVPLARLLGMRVVVTNHGPDYDRQKWGRLAKLMLRTGERLGARYAHRVIVISRVIADILATKYRRTDTDLIYNGVNTPVIADDRSYIDQIGVTKPYIFAMGRFVKEKGFHDLIDAYTRSGLSRDYNLVLAGDSDHPDAYCRDLKQQARDAGVILTGFIKGEPLRQCLSHAAIFAMPSYHEGLPIALLEAMSYGLDVAVSDIPANRIDALDHAAFFHVGNTQALADILRDKLAAPTRRVYDLSPYCWDNIARQTLDVYRAALKI